jgi:hypothetical protein
MVVNPHHFNVDPDPAFYFNADPDPAFHSILIRIQLLCDHWSINPQGLHFEPPGLHCDSVSVHGPPQIYFEPLKPLNFAFNADPDPDPVFDSNAAPDAASQKMWIRIRNHA